MRDAWRSGLQAIFSIKTPATIQITIANSMVGKKPKPSDVEAKNPTQAPSIQISPWAKLISLIIPQTMVYPSAISAKILPTDNPLISCCRNIVIFIPLSYTNLLFLKTSNKVKVFFHLIYVLPSQSYLVTSTFSTEACSPSFNDTNLIDLIGV